MSNRIHLCKSNIPFLIIIMLCLAWAVFFGYLKSGYYIDENYTYTISNGTQLGISVENGKWNSTEPFRSQVISVPGENFHFGQMWENTANDVHPPLYYIPVHFISSLFSGIYSKWIGLSVNIVLLIPMLILVREIARLLTDGNEIVSLLTVSFFGLAPVTVSNIMLIRMYTLLSLWTLLYVYLHIKALCSEDLSLKKFLVPLFLTGFCGFLTQYFFVIVMFFVSAIYTLYLLVICRRIRDSLIYGVTVLMSLVCTAVIWRHSKFHIFGGYRGKGAFDQILDLGKYYIRLRNSIVQTNDQLFGGLMSVFVLLLMIGNIIIVTKCIRKKSNGATKIVLNLPGPIKGLILMETAALLDYLVISQIGVFQSSESCRYFYQAYSMFTILIPVGIMLIYRYFKDFYHLNIGNLVEYITTTALLVALIIVCYSKDQVQFLYRFEEKALEWETSHPSADMIVIHNDDGNYDICIQDLLMYPDVYFASMHDLDTMTDDRLAGAKELLVYISVASTDDSIYLDYLFNENPNITQVEYLWNSYDFFNVYYLR